MSDSKTHNGGGCEGIEELIVWYPSGTLGGDERQRVEEHVEGCPVCADLLRFSSDLKGIVLEKHSPHPDAEALVCFVEDRSAMDPRQRLAIEEHLTVCPGCSEQAGMLEAVDRDFFEERETAPSISRAGEVAAGFGSRLGDFWNSLRAGLFKPVPAAVYLVVALLAVGLLLLRPGPWVGGISDRGAGETGVDTGTGSVPNVPGGVVILPDETGRVRHMGGEGAVAVRIDAGRAQFLLLELTGLEAPPKAEDTYTIEILRDGSSEPVLAAKVRGRDFSENYTICFPLGAGSLEPGVYVIRVTGPGGDIVFRSSLDAR